MLRIPKGKGDGTVAPSLGGSGAALGSGEEVVTPFATTPGYDTSTSTHEGELRRAAQRRSMSTCRECWPERLFRRAGEVRVSGLRLGERSSMR